MEEEMTTHSSILACTIPWTEEVGGLQSIGSQGLDMTSAYIPFMGSAKECSNYCTIVLITHTSKVMLKILQARLQQCVNCELPDVQAGFRKGRGTRDQIANIHWIIEKESSRKTSISALLTMPKPLSVWITINCGKFWKRWEYLTCLLRNLYAGQEITVRTGHGTTDWFRVGKGVSRLYIVTLLI